MAAELEKEQLDDLLCELLRRGDDVRTLMNPHTRHRCQFSRLRQRHSNAACRRCRAFLSFALRRHPFRWLEMEQRRLNEELERQRQEAVMAGLQQIQNTTASRSHVTQEADRVIGAVAHLAPVQPLSECVSLTRILLDQVRRGRLLPALGTGEQRSWEACSQRAQSDFAR